MNNYIFNSIYSKMYYASNFNSRTADLKLEEIRKKLFSLRKEPGFSEEDIAYVIKHTLDLLIRLIIYEDKSKGYSEYLKKINVYKKLLFDILDLGGEIPPNIRSVNIRNKINTLIVPMVNEWRTIRQYRQYLMEKRVPRDLAKMVVQRAGANFRRKKRKGSK